MYHEILHFYACFTYMQECQRQISSPNTENKSGAWLTAINFPLFSGLLATWIAAAVAAPDEIPTCTTNLKSSMSNTYCSQCPLYCSSHRLPGLNKPYKSLQNKYLINVVWQSHMPTMSLPSTYTTQMLKPCKFYYVDLPAILPLRQAASPSPQTHC